MSPEWLYALACYRVGLADRRALVAPSWSWFTSALDAESMQLLQLIDLAEDKAARQIDIEFAIERLLAARGLEAPDTDDARWIVVYGLATGAFQLNHYRLARFLGRLFQPTDHRYGLTRGLLATLDDFEDFVIGAAQAEQYIEQEFAAARTVLVGVAREHLDTNLQTRWMLKVLDSNAERRARIAPKT